MGHFRRYCPNVYLRAGKQNCVHWWQSRYADRTIPVQTAHVDQFICHEIILNDSFDVGNILCWLWLWRRKNAQQHVRWTWTRHLIKDRVTVSWHCWCNDVAERRRRVYFRPCCYRSSYKIPKPCIIVVLDGQFDGPALCLLDKKSSLTSEQNLLRDNRGIESSFCTVTILCKKCCLKRIGHQQCFSLLNGR